VFGGQVQVSGSAVHPVLTVSRNSTSDQLPTGKFEGTAGEEEDEDTDEGESVAVGEFESELLSDAGLLSLPADVEPPVDVEASDELLQTSLASDVFVDANWNINIPLVILLQSHGQPNAQSHNQRNDDSGNYSNLLPSPGTEPPSSSLPDVSKLLFIPITPYADTKIAPIVWSVLAALPRRGQSAARQHRHKATLLLVPVHMSMLYRSDMLMRWVVAECTFGGDLNLGRLGRCGRR